MSYEMSIEKLISGSGNRNASRNIGIHMTIKKKNLLADEK